MLKDNQVRYVDGMKAAGNDVELAVFAGKEHGFFSRDPWSETSGEVVRVVGRFMGRDAADSTGVGALELNPKHPTLSKARGQWLGLEGERPEAGETSQDVCEGRDGMRNDSGEDESGVASVVTPRPQESVGFIGLGNMGAHMARNLVRAGYRVSVHDINEVAMKKFSDDGIPTKRSPLEVSESSDVVITMLPSSAHVLDVYSGRNGLLGNGGRLGPWLYIDSSTVDPHTSRKISMDMSRCSLNEKKGYAEKPMMMDAPVSGGVPAAEAGTLTFMVGGLEETYIAAKPLLLAMGKKLIYCGGAGNGSAAKLCNNMAMAISMLGVSEAFALGQNLGIKASTLTDIFNCSSARCWSSDTYNPVPGVMAGVPSSRNYDGGFTSKLMAKDLDLAMASASGVGFKCPVGSEALEIYRKLCDEGCEFKDFSCAFRHFYTGKDEK
ncbi:unnamed protein product [Triticum turgidum subsp. durum]|uniref:3-hydroxyisobutyrate dehydrogenase n=1 Tax=Triticum turgidum subsp. durum TaxID=4567 RepID=A0A9R0ZMS0_TRITD|nr:unnamed protein product [Triticum turgidum subsp. durum]